MNQIDEIVSKLREIMPGVREKYHVKTLEAFGSYVRSEQREESDVDILVEFGKTIDLFMYMELEDFLSETLGIKVDPVMKDTLKPLIREKILREAISQNSH